MKITISLDENKLNIIKDRIAYWNMVLDHPEDLPTEEDQEKVFQQWRGAKFILRNLGIEF